MSGRYSDAAEGLLRSTVLDTVADLVIDHDWDHLSMAKIAAGAGVSRQTLYNEFGDRDGLLEAYVIREAGRFLEGVEEAIVDHQDLNGALLDGFRWVLESAEDHPVIHAVVTGRASVHVFDPLVAASSRPVVDLAAGQLATIIDTRWPGFDHADVAAVSDVFVRLAISYLTQGQVDIERCLDTVSRVFAPAIESLTS